jgi:hypothetical protein
MQLLQPLNWSESTTTNSFAPANKTEPRQTFLNCLVVREPDLPLLEKQRMALERASSARLPKNAPRFGASRVVFKALGHVG